MVKVLDYQSRGSRFQKHWVAPSSTHPIILMRLIKSVPGISGNLETKSGLPFQSVSLVALRQLNVIHKKGHELFFYDQLYGL